MSDSFAELIRTAGSLPEALAALGRAADEILARLEARPPQHAALPVADPWTTWDVAAPQREGAAHKLELGRVQEQLRTETDPETIQALNAKLSLLKDKGAVPENVLPGDMVGVDEANVVHLPTADPERQAYRRKWAIQHELGPQFLAMDLTEAADAFAKGGPLWLYYGNRPALVSMPADWKRAFVHDVEKDSVREAQAMGRDILKDLAPGTSEVTLESMGSEWDHNHA